MGILRSFKKAIGGKAESEADKAIAETPPSAGEETAEQEFAPDVEPQQARVEQGDGSYTVQSGDTLWNIAETVYGDGSKYAEIFDANADLLEQPDRIYPGQKLRIPTQES